MLWRVPWCAAAQVRGVLLQRGSVGARCVQNADRRGTDLRAPRADCCEARSPLNSSSLPQVSNPCISRKLWPSRLRESASTRRHGVWREGEGGEGGRGRKRRRQMVAPPVCTGGTTARTRSSGLSWCCTWRSKAQARVRWGHRGRDMVSMAMAVLTTEKRFRLADGAGAYPR